MPRLMRSGRFLQLTPERGGCPGVLTKLGNKVILRSMSAEFPMESRVFEVVGVPMSKGSITVYQRRPVNACKGEKEWAEAVGWAARDVAPRQPWDGPIGLELRFSMPRPKRCKRGNRDPHGRDCDKMIRSTIDAMTGIMFVDDRQVTDIVASKRLALEGAHIPYGVRITVRRLPESDDCWYAGE